MDWRSDQFEAAPSHSLEWPDLPETTGPSRTQDSPSSHAYAPLMFQGVRGMDGPHGPKGSLVSNGHGDTTQTLASVSLVTILTNCLLLIFVLLLSQLGLSSLP